MKFSSSRTFPTHGQLTSAFIVSDGIFSIVGSFVGVFLREVPGKFGYVFRVVA